MVYISLLNLDIFFVTNKENYVLFIDFVKPI